jgi:hypothetical protein
VVRAIFVVENLEQLHVSLASVVKEGTNALTLTYLNVWYQKDSLILVLNALLVLTVIQDSIAQAMSVIYVLWMATAQVMVKVTNAAMTNAL